VKKSQKGGVGNEQRARASNERARQKKSKNALKLVELIASGFLNELPLKVKQAKKEKRGEFFWARAEKRDYRTSSQKIGLPMKEQEKKGGGKSKKQKKTDREKEGQRTCRQGLTEGFRSSLERKSWQAWGICRESFRRNVKL